jgi:hypothetical protein
MCKRKEDEETARKRISKYVAKRPSERCCVRAMRFQGDPIQGDFEALR